MDKSKLKEEKIQVKMSSRELATMRKLADAYAGGNLSRWIRFAAVEMGRKMEKRK